MRVTAAAAASSAAMAAASTVAMAAASTVAAAALVFSVACGGDEAGRGHSIGGGAPGGGGAGAGTTTSSSGVGGAGGARPPLGAGQDCSDGAPTSEALAALLYDVVGFGAHTTGGLRGCVYHVTTLDDAGPGSLRAGLEPPGPRWIVFDLGGIITLGSFITVTDDKTIDGRGQLIELREAGLLIEDGVANVVVHNLLFGGGQSGAADDAITVYGGAHDVWIDHCGFETYPDGQVDITEQSTDVTVSWSRFAHHGKVMLIGADPASTGDTVIAVTLHHNWFDHTDERHPRLRYGRVHAFNNLLVGWLYYGMGSSQTGQLFAEANIFEAGGDTDGIIAHVGSDPQGGHVAAANNLLLAGATIELSSPALVFDPSAAYGYTAVMADAALRSAVEKGAGRQDVPLPGG